MAKYAQRPVLTLDTSRKYVAQVQTNRGEFTMELLPDIAPEHVNSFVFLARERFFNGTVFHRVEPGFVVQGGDPTGTGTGGPRVHGSPGGQRGTVRARGGRHGPLT